MANVSLNAVRKNYDETLHKDTLRNINLDIKEGEFIVFVGPSGCGKSTLLRMIAGLEDITSGELKIGDSYMNDVPPVERNVGMVFQSYALYPHMDLRENMSFGLKLKKMDAATIKKRVDNASDILGLDPLLERKPKELSGGQRQRVAIGRCIVQQPNVFLFDEPLSNLDAALRVKMRIEIAKLHKELQSTIIYVTHDQVEAMTLADKIVVLSPLDEGADSNLEQFGSPLDLYHNPDNKFVAGFIGSPKMNFVDATLVEINAKDCVVELITGERVTAAVDANRAKVGDAVQLGIRPEHLVESEHEHAQSKVTGIVQVTEHLGSESFVYMDVKGCDFTFKARPEFPAEAGDQLTVGIPTNACYLFDENELAFQRTAKYNRGA
ncbi:sn-glycerol-3-phosphate ABC transporter ATP-binding protein UgpC [Alginatibacterium sediminis]|uniref:sn-glycerol-3-phosphate ABC transporter ATP-binding protein UgpC n=1 Tax=Alginatibacterium sediminis TaxID=2164068 RepID=A0A420EFX1_9ALTE|nr:sn-glycerol-3-phosphate ABC transporter ATP-binding protein UgpC [Alginatibacterium sediminis]RKF19554.1 sn-glycerol-3-phosphate ABC transporter ATP-binding protein UgpC [Alginatibacterium sediminis]